MKIYFAGSIRGGRDDVNVYAEIIALLQKYGTVLTEHLADKTITSYGQTNMTDAEIYTKDTNWIKEADVVIAEVTNPSLGVGYEIGFAEALKKKVIALYRIVEGKRTSAMIAGNASVQCIIYKDVSELQAIFATILK